MKAIFTLGLCFIASVSFGQSTTQTEFNYIKKGIAETEEKGLDLKAGYTLQPKEDYMAVNNKYSIKFVLVVRTNNTLAGTLILIKSKGGAFENPWTKYYCLPAPNLKTSESFGWKEYNNDLMAMPTDLQNSLLQYMSYKASLYFSTPGT